MGGIWARYAIGLLYERGLLIGSTATQLDEDAMEPMLFTTFATPHIGCVYPGTSKTAFLFNLFGRNLFGQSGRDLFLRPDILSPSGTIKHSEDARPILMFMADPTKSPYKALSLFKHLVLYANATNDQSVPFYTSYISAKDPFKFPRDIHIVYKKSKPSAIAGHTGEKLIAEIDLAESKYRSQTTKKGLKSSNRHYTVPVSILLGALGVFVVPSLLVVLGVSTIISDIRVRSFISEHTKEFEDSSDGVTPEEVLQDKSRPLSEMQAILPIFDSSIPELNLEDSVKEMITSLNKLPWEKHIVHFHKMRTHEEIINLGKGSGAGYDFIKYWASQVKSKL